MKKKILTRILAVCFAAITLIGGAIAAVNSAPVQVDMNFNLPIMYNGEIQTFKDVTGKTVYPLVYQGTTYLPVRAVCSLAGIPVKWDQETGTILLGNGDRKYVDENIFKNWMVVGEGADVSWIKDDPALLTVDGKLYQNGVRLNETSSMNRRSFGCLNLDGKYKDYSVLHTVVESSTDGTLYFTTCNWYGTMIDDLPSSKILTSIDLKAGVPTEVNVQIGNNTEVHFGWKEGNPSQKTDLRMVDLWLK